MGSAARQRPRRLAEKLKSIRLNIDGGLSQNQLIKRLGLENELQQERISKYERSVLEPSLLILIAYADLAKISLDVLARDDIDLPKRLRVKL